MYRVILFPTFEKEASKVLSSYEILQFKRKIQILKNRGLEIGKPLYPYYFRELKFSGKRVYYLVYENILLILMIAVSNKKNSKSQQQTIDKIRERLPEFEEYILKVMRK